MKHLGKTHRVNSSGKLLFHLFVVCRVRKKALFSSFSAIVCQWFEFGVIRKQLFHFLLR